MGRKKRSQKKDDFLYRMAYISHGNPNTYDIIDEKGKNIEKYSKIKFKRETEEGRMTELIYQVKQTIDLPCQQNIIPSFSLTDIEFSSEFLENEELINKNSPKHSFIFLVKNKI